MASTSANTIPIIYVNTVIVIGYKITSEELISIWENTIKPKYYPNLKYEDNYECITDIRDNIIDVLKKEKARKITIYTPYRTTNYNSGYENEHHVMYSSSFRNDMNGDGYDRASLEGVKKDCDMCIPFFEKANKILYPGRECPHNIEIYASFDDNG
jgi:hypothetical protein